MVDTPHAVLIAQVHGIDANYSRPGLKAAARRCVETERDWKASVARYENVYARFIQQVKYA